MPSRLLVRTAALCAAAVTFAVGCATSTDDAASADDALAEESAASLKTLVLGSDATHDRRTFAYLEWGPADGPRAFLFHGFPDTAHTWDSLAPELARAGYHVIAPYMRGYAPSSPAPGADVDYSAFATGHDVLDLVAAFNARCDATCAGEKVVLVGHDWGALAVYTAVAIDDSVVSKLVTIAIPHPSTVNPLTPDYWPGGTSDHFAYLGLVPWALDWFSANDFQGVDYYDHKWSPHWNAGPNETKWVKKSFRSSGAAGAIGYYKSLARLQHGIELASLNQKRVRVPTLTIYGTEDGATNTATFAKTPPAFVGCADHEGGPKGASCHYELVSIAGAGHFVHREKPAAVTRAVTSFLGPAR